MDTLSFWGEIDKLAISQLIKSLSSLQHLKLVKNIALLVFPSGACWLTYGNLVFFVRHCYRHFGTSWQSLAQDDIFHWTGSACARKQLANLRVSLAWVLSVSWVQVVDISNRKDIQHSPYLERLALRACFRYWDYPANNAQFGSGGDRGRISRNN